MAFDDTGDSGKPKPDDPGCPFTEGDVVHLVCGGPRLVVGCVEDDFILEVHWFDGRVLRRDCLPFWCFVKCDHPA